MKRYDLTAVNCPYLYMRFPDSFPDLISKFSTLLRAFPLLSGACPNVRNVRSDNLEVMKILFMVYSVSDARKLWAIGEIHFITFKNCMLKELNCR